MRAAIDPGLGSDPPENARRGKILNSICVACGQENSSGLRIRFNVLQENVVAIWRPTREWQSFERTVHGGIIATVLDEAMSQAIMARNWGAMTADLRVRFHLRVVPGECLGVKGWVVGRRKRKILAEASLTAENGEERAHAPGSFSRLVAGLGCD